MVIRRSTQWNSQSNKHRQGHITYLKQLCVSLDLISHIAELRILMALEVKDFWNTFLVPEVLYHTSWSSAAYTGWIEEVICQNIPHFLPALYWYLQLSTPWTTATMFHLNPLITELVDNIFDSTNLLWWNDPSLIFLCCGTITLLQKQTCKCRLTDGQRGNQQHFYSE